MYKVAVFDEEHEKDLERKINTFLAGISENQFVEIQYDVAVLCDETGEQVYCFSAMILYKK
ncbi:sporulation protein Cse60 [Bacillus lacus]|uniref:Sporulation protein Cse60 n=1 Tax=Metabacillus lacus TaxID=1983721 RepID=A0A7X2J3C7_9BACI|nr:sporulation protein Cse60 [Metabacillus lacus]MRX73963.1 sporulation protein Cse60 [Metabacillus lacus]